MTTAHRPTFDPARGKSTISRQAPASHARQLAGQTVLKIRKPGQGGDADAQQPFGAPSFLPPPRSDREELRERLRIAEGFSTAGGVAAAVDEKAGLESEEDDLETPPTKRRRLSQDAAATSPAPPSNPTPQDSNALSAADDDEDDDEDDNSDSGESSEDETEALHRELSKIRAERAAAKALAETEAVEAAELEAVQRSERTMRGNPLLGDVAAGGKRDFGVKRRWDSDVVFKNQASGAAAVKRDQGKEEPRFVNDLLRSDFHKKFMGKYVR